MHKIYVKFLMMVSHKEHLHGEWYVLGHTSIHFECDI